MRKIDESRAANYIRKHSNYKKWLAFVLCLSLLTGTITLYILNKPATAMTEEGAESVGLILETADAEEEAELIQQTIENKEAFVGYLRGGAWHIPRPYGFAKTGRYIRYMDMCADRGKEQQ